MSAEGTTAVTGNATVVVDEKLDETTTESTSKSTAVECTAEGAGVVRVSSSVGYSFSKSDGMLVEVGTGTLNTGRGVYASNMRITQRNNAVSIEIDRIPPLLGLACTMPVLVVPKSGNRASYETSWTCVDPGGAVYRLFWEGDISCSNGTISWTSRLEADRNNTNWCSWDLRGTYTK